MKRLLTGSVAALILVASQAAAVAPSLAPLGATDRADASSQAGNRMFGSSLTWIVLAVWLAAIIAVETRSHDGPSSP